MTLIKNELNPKHALGQRQSQKSLSNGYRHLKIDPVSMFNGTFTSNNRQARRRKKRILRKLNK